MLYDLMEMPKNRRISASVAFCGKNGRGKSEVAPYAPIFEGEESLRQDEQLIAWLRATVRGLVQHFNDAVGDEVLYYSECTCFWRLYGRPTEYDADKMLASGLLTVEGLSRLVCRLQNEMGVEV